MFHVRSSVLPNGLRVVVLELPHAHSATAALFVRSGPQYEDEASNGISHFVEHLLFRGTHTHPTSLAFNVAVERLGGEINGMTQRDATAIHITVPPKHADQGLELLAEMCTQPLFSGIEIERRVVIEEILDTLDAEGNELDIDTLSRGILWDGHPLGFPVAGDVSTVEALTESDCRRHFERTFVAKNSVLCIAGRVIPSEIIETAREAFASMPSGQALVLPPSPRPQTQFPIHIQPSDDSQVGVLLSYAAPHENDGDFATLLLLKRILDDGFASRLRQSICEQRGLAYSVSASVDAYRDAGAFDVELTCAPHKVVPAVRQVLTTLKELTEAEVSTDELERAKTRYLAEFEFGLDDPTELCTWYGTTELLDCRVGYRARMGEVLATRPGDIRALSQAILKQESSLLTLVGTLEDTDIEALEVLLGHPLGSSLFLSPEEDEEEPPMALASGQ